MTSTATWQTLFINVNIATMDDGSNSCGAINNGALAIADGKIAWIGEQSILPAFDKNLV